MSSGAGNIRQAIIVDGSGTDEEIADAYAKEIPDWEEWCQAERDEAVRHTRTLNIRGRALTIEVAEVNGAAELSFPKERPTLSFLRQAATFGTGSEHFANYALTELAKHLGTVGMKLDVQTLNAALAFIEGGKPSSPHEASLLVQMFLTNHASMIAQRRWMAAEFVDQAVAFGNLSVKLANTYARQSEVLSKIQRGATQTVNHVHTYNVDARRQTAIVTPPAATHVEEQGHEQGNGGSAQLTALLGQDESGFPLPLTGDARAQTVPAPRRKGQGGPKG